MRDVKPINLIFFIAKFALCKILFMKSGKNVMLIQIEIARINSDEKKVLKFIDNPY
jgi:hypothetical protein